MLFNAPFRALAGAVLSAALMLTFLSSCEVGQPNDDVSVNGQKSLPMRVTDGYHQITVLDSAIHSLRIDFLNGPVVFVETKEGSFPVSSGNVDLDSLFSKLKAGELPDLLDSIRQAAFKQALLSNPDDLFLCDSLAWAAVREPSSLLFFLTGVPGIVSDTAFSHLAVEAHQEDIYRFDRVAGLDIAEGIDRAQDWFSNTVEYALPLDPGADGCTFLLFGKNGTDTLALRYRRAIFLEGDAGRFKVEIDRIEIASTTLDSARSDGASIIVD